MRIVAFFLLPVLGFTVLAPCVAGQQVLYILSSSDTLYRVANYATAPTAVLIGPTGVANFDIATDPLSGNLFGAMTTLHGLNASSGAATVIGPLGVGVNALDFDQAGVLYGWGGNTLYTINKNTGVATTVGQGGFMSGGDIAFDAGGALYGVTDNDELVLINKANGASLLVGSLGVSGPFFALDIDVGGTIYAPRTDGNLYTVNKTTGAATLLGSIAGLAPTEEVAGAAFLLTPSNASEYQVNSFNATLDVNGVLGTAFVPAVVTVPVGATATLNLLSFNAGMPWDIGYGVAPLIPLSAGALTSSDGQIVNLNLADPTASTWFNILSQSPPFASFSAPFSFPFATSVSVQMIIVAPSLPSGIALSQPTRLQ